MEETFTKAIDILYLAKQNDVDIVLNGDQLQLKIPNDKTIDEDLLKEIRANKKIIIDLLSNDAWKSTIINNSNYKIKSFERNVVNPIPLSFSQERLWFIDRLEGSLQYHLPEVLRLKGALNREALSKALGAIVDRHEILRTVYREENGQVYQEVKPAGNWVLRESEGSKYKEDQAGLDKYIAALTQAPFDLGKDDMFRAELIRLGPLEHILVVTMHHIASDASSMPVLVREVASLYEAYVSGTTPSLPALPLQYADYAVWQRGHIRGEFLEEKLTYWKEKLADVPPLQLPADYERTSNGSARGRALFFEIGEELSRRVQALGHTHGATLYMTLLAAFKVLLYRYSGQEDICVGTSVANRPQRELEELIGFFVNTLALRDQVRGEMSFTALLDEVKATTLGAYGHQEVPFEKVVDAVVKERQAGISPLFQVMLVLDNTPEVPELKLGELSLGTEGQEQTTTKFDLTLFIRETKEGFQGAIQYNTDLYREERIQRMASHFCELLQSVAEAPQAAVGKLEIFSKQERNELQQFGISESPYPKEATIADLFEAEAAKHPDREAVVFSGETVSYKELNERANRLAHELQRLGVKQDMLVPLYTARGIEMLTGILGILKAGGAYVPIDTDFPEERISYMLEDTGAQVAVSSGEYTGRLQKLSGGYIAVAATDSPDKTAATTNPIRNLKPEHLAYVIYTSGSTGKPKGVEVSHGNLVDYVYGLEARTGISACKSYALVSTIATDLGNTVLYSSLLLGGTLHVFTRETVSHIEELHAYFEANRIDCLKIVPSHWKALSPEDSAPLLPGRMLIFGGEALPYESVARIRNYSMECRIFNHYGPTETTVGKLVYEITGDHEGNIIPIGKPFSNTKAYILTKELSPCPIGVPGQLYIAGQGVARGYLNRPELTAEKFISDPNGKEGAKMYGTGDRAAYQGDGNIVFMGRTDDQVKIRGYRVEPGEVGRLLEQSGHISQAVVISREDKQGNSQLVGYIVPQGAYDKQAIQTYLKEQLPDYMIPSHLVELTSLPLTANGKIDRRALPDPEGTEQAGEHIAPQNETEAKLAGIWQEVLEVDEVSVNDDFFELGGHSLLAVRLISMIRKTLGVELPISDVFDYPTVAKLAARIIKEPEGELLPAVTATERPDRIPLSFSQERLWFIDKLEGSVQYHTPAVLRLKGELNKEALEQTLRSVIDRHEVLRTVIKEHEGRGYQQIMSPANWTLGITDGVAGGETGLSKCIAGLINKPFGLSEDYMLRADLIRLSPEDHILVVTMHHIASDGWSRSILVREVAALYKGYAGNKEPKLPALNIQYADYAMWQRSYMQGELLEAKLGYWKAKLAGVATLQLPADYSRPQVQRSRGATQSFSIDAAITAQLRMVSQAHGATLYMTLLAAFKVLLYRYSGQEDICVGTSVAGRNQQELEGLIGFFVNTLALRDQMRGEMTFTELLGAVKATTLEAYAHQEVPFEKVVDAVVKERDMSRNPLFQVMLVLINTPEVPELKLGELLLSEQDHEQTTTKFELTFFIKETKDSFQGEVQYNTDLYSPERIGRMTSHFGELLASAVRTPEMAIGQLEILSEAERQQMLGFGQSISLYPAEATIADLFETQAQQFSDREAVVFAGESISYKELNERANRLAHELQRLGVKEDTLVPLYTSRSIDMLTGILGILKAGGAYVPMDTDFPGERISYMLEDTGAFVAVSSGEYTSQLSSLSAGYLEVIKLDSLDKPGLTPISNPNRSLRPEHLAYVIYTSGSTGRPKGVEVSHGNLVDYVYGLDAHTGISKCRSFALVSTIATDLGNTVLYSSLLFGGTLHIFTHERVSHIEALHEYFREHKIDCLKIVPSHWKALSPEDGVPLMPERLLIFGGENFPVESASRMRHYGKECCVLNHYGPTETTIGKLVYELSPEGNNGRVVPIGRPFSNTRVYVLSKEGMLCPVGVPGQLHISGAGVARGYLKRPELTSEKFIKDPYGVAGDRMYQTGDQVQYLEDGNIIFIGRVDDQVKIRGYRVEPSGVSQILEESDLVSQAVVLSRDDKQGNKQLVGYIVPAGEFDRTGIQNYLKKHVPDYMIPAHLVEMESLPLAQNGKIDRKALPDPEGTSHEGGYVAPRNEREAMLAEIWADVLEVDQVGITDDFFELGGHSLLAVRLVSSIWKVFGVELQINDIFVYPTIAGLIGQLESKKKTISPLLIPIKVTGNKIPLYIICGTGGTILKFVNFVKMLDPEQPVYGLQQPVDSNDLDGFPNTTEGIAAMYIREILKLNPFGPYALTGHCFGGNIAFEMAMQLKSMGKEISMLGMFDAYPREEEEIVPATINNYYHIPDIIKKSFSKISLKIKFEMFLLLRHPKQSFIYKIEKVKSLLGLNKPKPGAIKMDSFNNVSKIFKTASRSYLTKYYDGEIFVFYAKEKYYFMDRNKRILYKRRVDVSSEKKNAWQKYAKSIKIYEIEGDHSTIFVPKYAGHFAGILQNHLNNINIGRNENPK